MADFIFYMCVFVWNHNVLSVLEDQILQSRGENTKLDKGEYACTWTFKNKYSVWLKNAPWTLIC